MALELAADRLQSQHGSPPSLEELARHTGLVRARCRVFLSCTHADPNRFRYRRRATRSRSGWRTGGRPSG
jgi:hypothetical protein